MVVSFASFSLYRRAEYTTNGIEGELSNVDGFYADG
jgi:hypothetical protein